MSTVTIPNDLRVNGSLTVGGNNPAINRSDLVQDTEQSYALPLESFRVFDDYASLLPGTPVTDDLGLVGGTHGTNVPSLQTEDLKAAGSTDKKARTTFQLPPEYEDGATVKIKFTAGMLTNPADTAATLDVAIYEFGTDTTVSGADLVQTAALSINSTTFNTYEFSMNSTALVAGDLLDILITMNVNDGATGTEVKGVISYAEMLVDIQG